ncbi:hypothetical protein [Shewanella sp. FJAT-52076]|uniref:hypothetical protein n=1 Tax=Shewanella sp. FJAT-52076 TaxID=2864202 RepID=UPI001C658928|nr:hypothetical protein [Shewanella sp. FJAT-52076]QYJ74486.1 hypothetical protein K0H79_14120 [Shewanella sp. FJAT-52076]
MRRLSLMELPALTSQVKMKISGLFNRPFTQPFTRMLSGLKQFWHSLNFAQRSYVTATLLLLVETVLMLDFGPWFLGLMCLLVLTGLVSEFWPRFLHLWHSLPGKALILLFYAVVANFALGNAAGMVNEVTGVAASSLPYSHNFAILLSLPGWFFITSLLMLLLAQVAMPFYLLLLLLLKPFGIHALWHPPHYRFVFTTALVRWFWSIALLIQLLMLGAFTGVGSDSSAFTSGLYEGFFEADEKVQKQVIDTGILPIPADDSKASAAAEALIDTINEGAGNKAVLTEAALNNESVTEAAEGSDGSFGVRISRDGETTNLASMPVREMKDRAERYHSLQQSMLAYFIYVYESDSRSRCQHAEGSKVVELNDYEILEIQKDDSIPLGYSYSVKRCISPAFGQ